jgi:hypothetical protein
MTQVQVRSLRGVALWAMVGLRCMRAHSLRPLRQEMLLAKLREAFDLVPVMQERSTCR